MKVRAAHVRALCAAALAALWMTPSGSAQTLTQTQALGFGRVALGAGSGSVTITPSGSASCGPHYCLGSHQVGSFQVTGGLPLQQFDITFSSGDVLTRQGGSETLDLENLSDSRGGTITLGLLGRGDFDVGGDLVVPSTTTPGAYDGSYEVNLELP